MRYGIRLCCAWHAALQLAIVLTPLCFSVPIAAKSTAAAPEAVLLTHSINPSFEPNQGQFHAAVKYAANRHPYQAYLRSDAIALSLFRANHGDAPGQAKERAAPATVAIQLVGANPEAHVIAEQQTPERSNYFFGAKPEGWITDVPHFAAVTFVEAYPGIDLRHYAKNGKLEYDFVAKAGANLKAIRLRVVGAERTEIDAAGDLLIHAGGQVLKHRRPLAMQEARKSGAILGARYEKTGADEFQLAIDGYDASQPLIIDPIIDFGTVYGGGVAALTGAVDARGDVYLSGATTWPGFPTVNPFDGSHPDEHIGALPVPVAFVTKIDPLGQHVRYSTFIGGEGGAVVRAIRVDDDGNVYLAGQAGNGLPTTPGVFLGGDAAPPVPAIYFSYGSFDRADQSLAFVLKLQPSGSALGYSTYVAQVDQVNALAIDAAGAAHIAGATKTASLPTSAGTLQAARVAEVGKFSGYLAKLNASGSEVQYGTYFGGAGGDTVVSALALGADGSAHLTGYTTSTALPLEQAFQSAKRGGEDAFVAKFTPDAHALVYSSYLGGSDTNCMNGADFGTAIAVDDDGYAYVAGRTYSALYFPVSSGTRGSPYGFVDVFVSKVAPLDGALVRSVLLGGNDADSVSCGAGLGTGERPTAIWLNADKTVTVAGLGATPNIEIVQFAFPLANPVATNGSGFAITLNPTSLVPVFSTVFPGTTGAAANRFGDIYLFGAINGGFLRKPETALPIFPGALSIADPGGKVAYLARILRPTAHLTLSTESDTATAGQAFDLKADLAGIYEAGEIEFLEGDAVLGRTPIAEGATSASFRVTGAALGFHRYTARFVSPLLPHGLRSGTRYLTLVAPECD
ncbi:MAG: SBBP repeat-containing protein [Betaproteobacteria bacterium]|nr:SBBP repeat-containing protein [Betaproteobacteria bacterium]